MDSPTRGVFATHFASIKNGRIALISENALPEHELKSNQISLTRREFTLLYAMSDLAEIEKNLVSIREKIKRLNLTEV